MEALEQAVGRTETIVKTAMDGIVTFSKQSLEILTLNPAAKSIFGYPGGQLVGQPIGRLLAPTEDEPATLISNMSHNYRQLTGRRADGSVFPMEVVVTETHLGGDAFCVGTFHDITEHQQAIEALQESENRYRSLIENLPIAIYRNTPGPKGRFLMGNPAMAKMFGYDSIDQLFVVNVAEQYKDAAQRKIFSDRLIAEGSVSGFELEGQKLDGSPM